VAFGVEFAAVGFKVLNTLREARAMPQAKAPELPPVDVTRLAADMQDVIGSSVGQIHFHAGVRLIPPAVHCSKESQPQIHVANGGNFECPLGVVSGGRGDTNSRGYWLTVAENGELGKTHGPPRPKGHIEASRLVAERSHADLTQR
jgi:hypothetical protein